MTQVTNQVESGQANVDAARPEVIQQEDGDKLVRSRIMLDEAIAVWKPGMTVEIRFSRATDIVVQGRRVCREVLTTARLCKSRGDQYLYMPRSNSRSGWVLGPEQLRIIDKVELKDCRKDLEFKDFREFESRFDLRFISSAEIRNLWNKNSCQTGRPYNKGDFRRLGSEGRELMERFLRLFKDIHTKTPSHIANSYGEYLTVRRESNSPTNGVGRDLSVSHKWGLPYVWWNSEYPGCGNGSYYLVTTERTMLHIEND